MKKIIGLVVLSLILIGCNKSEDCINERTIINNTIIYNTTFIREVGTACPECEYTTKYVVGLMNEAKKCEKDFTYLDLEDCEDDIEDLEDDMDDLDERWDECRDELDDCEDELCDLNSSSC